MAEAEAQPVVEAEAQPVVEAEAQPAYRPVHLRFRRVRLVSGAQLAVNAKVLLQTAPLVRLRTRSTTGPAAVRPPAQRSTSTKKSATRPRLTAQCFVKPRPTASAANVASLVIPSSRTIPPTAVASVAPLPAVRRLCKSRAAPSARGVAAFLQMPRRSRARYAASAGEISALPMCSLWGSTCSRHRSVQSRRTSCRSQQARSNALYDRLHQSLAQHVHSTMHRTVSVSSLAHFNTTEPVSVTNRWAPSSASLAGPKCVSRTTHALGAKNSRHVVQPIPSPVCFV
ncbi:hypothetical protein C8R47DRAFT_1087471 [Mycena vitilis]|nr:hypothetical protein C8R47DRAFT_1087471 [Mycena vitilis]